MVVRKGGLKSSIRLDFNKEANLMSSIFLPRVYSQYLDLSWNKCRKDRFSSFDTSFHICAKLSLLASKTPATVSKSHTQ